MLPPASEWEVTSIKLIIGVIGSQLIVKEEMYVYVHASLRLTKKFLKCKMVIRENYSHINWRSAMIRKIVDLVYGINVAEFLLGMLKSS